MTRVPVLASLLAVVVLLAGCGADGPPKRPEPRTSADAGVVGAMQIG
ncbi:MAG: hypothetical protein RLZZ491_218 [Pseudomonadota bacterium]|jgi:predicted small lipoprotein YifL